ncbi:MAG: MFS transporter [Pseudomonadota bacterium]
MSIVSGAFFYARGIFLPSMADDFGGSRLDVTLAFTVAQAVGAFAAPVIGLLLDRYHPRYILLGGAIMVSIGYVLTSLVETHLQLYLVFGLLFGAGWRSISSFATSRVLVQWFHRRRGLALSLDVAGASFAGVFVPVVAIWLMAEFGWRPGFAAFAILTMGLVVPLVIFVIHRSPEDLGLRPDGDSVSESAPEVVQESDRAWTAKGILQTPAFWGVVFVFSAMFCVLQGVNMHLFGHFTNGTFSAETAGFLLAVMAALILAGKPVQGWLSDHFGAKLTIGIALVSQIVGVGLFWVGGASFTVAMLGVIFYGFGFSGVTPLQSVATAAVFGKQSYGRANGLMQPFMLPVALLASPMAAWIYDTTGSYASAFLLFMIVMVFALPVLMLLKLRPPKNQSPDRSS